MHITKKTFLFLLYLFTAFVFTSISVEAHEGHDHNHDHDHDHHEELEVSTPEPSETINQESETVFFTAPTGWRLAESSSLPKNVKMMVVGKGEYEYPPSINLGAEKFNGTLKEYLKIVKSLNDAQGVEWKDLGKIKTDAGNASLSQVDLNTEWGSVRMMHVILVKSGTAYILTSAARKEEFPKFYKDFFTSMRSFKINK